MAERITDRIGRLARLAAGRPPVLPGDTHAGAGGGGYGSIYGGTERGVERGQAAGSAPPRGLRAGRRAGAPTASFRSHVTARGALVGVFLLCLVTCLLAAWLGHDVLAGLGFCAAGVLTPVYARRDAQLSVVLALPATFLLAELLTQAVTASGHSAVTSVFEGTILTLADVAPWLFAGSIACVMVAMTRGLPDCIRALRAAQSGLSPARAAGAPSQPRAGSGLQR